MLSLLITSSFNQISFTTTTVPCHLFPDPAASKIRLTFSNAARVSGSIPPPTGPDPDPPAGSIPSWPETKTRPPARTA